MTVSLLDFINTVYIKGSSLMMYEETIKRNLSFTGEPEYSHTKSLTFLIQNCDTRGSDIIITLLALPW